MLRGIEVHNAPPVVRDDEKAVERTERECRHSEEVHRGNRLAMVAEKRRPSLCGLRISRRFPHPSQNSPLRNIDAEHLQLAMYARRTPGWVLADHAKDESAQLPANTSSSSPVPMPRDPRPIQ